MAGTFNTPIGAIPRPMAYLAIVGGVGGLGWAYIHKRNKDAAAAAAATASAGTDTGTSTDTSGSSSGYDYGAYTYDPYGNDPYGYGYGQDYSGGVYGAGGGGYYPPGAGVQSPVPATTNAQWVNAAVSALGAAGWSQQAVLSALGKYVTGQTVTADEEGIVTAAIGAEGNPPQPGANGYPPNIRTAGVNTGGTGGGSGNVTVPHLTGMDYGLATNTLRSAGLVISPAKQHSNWIVKSQSPAAGKSVAKGSTVTVVATSGGK